MVYGIVRNHKFRFVVVVPAGIQIAIEARKITAGNFHAQPVPGEKIIAEIDWLESDFVNFFRLHPDRRFVVAVAIAHALDVFNQIERTAIGINVVYAKSEIGIFRAR